MAHVFIFYLREDKEAEGYAETLIEGRTWSADNKWSVRADPAHVPGMKDHVHVMLKGQEVSVINSDGTPSHNTDRSDVPGWLIARMVVRGLIKEASEEEGESLVVPIELIEGAVHHNVLINLSLGLPSKQS